MSLPTASRKVIGEESEDGTANDSTSTVLTTFHSDDMHSIHEHRVSALEYKLQEMALHMVSIVELIKTNITKQTQIDTAESADPKIKDHRDVIPDSKVMESQNESKSIRNRLEEIERKLMSHSTSIQFMEANEERLDRIESVLLQRKESNDEGPDPVITQIVDEVTEKEMAINQRMDEMENVMNDKYRIIQSQMTTDSASRNNMKNLKSTVTSLSQRVDVLQNDIVTQIAGCIVEKSAWREKEITRISNILHGVEQSVQENLVIAESKCQELRQNVSKVESMSRDNAIQLKVQMKSLEDIKSSNGKFQKQQKSRTRKIEKKIINDIEVRLVDHIETHTEYIQIIEERLNTFQEKIRKGAVAVKDLQQKWEMLMQACNLGMK